MLLVNKDVIDNVWSYNHYKHGNPVGSSITNKILEMKMYEVELPDLMV